jgi:probable rRNA maturation factor
MNQLDIQIATQSCELPESQHFQQWVDAALGNYDANTEIVIRLVDEAESAQLNEQYRQKLGPTNILSFPFEVPRGMQMDLLGDLVICAPLVKKEVRQQQKLQDHWAHIIVHGVLHLLGYDHIEEVEAGQMEALEIDILQHLKIANPYLEDSTP